MRGRTTNSSKWSKTLKGATLCDGTGENCMDPNARSRTLTYQAGIIQHSKINVHAEAGKRGQLWETLHKQSRCSTHILSRSGMLYNAQLFQAGGARKLVERGAPKQEAALQD